MNYNKSKSLISVVLCVCLLFTTMFSLSPSANASTVSAIEDELSNIEEKIKSNQAKLDEIAGDKSKQSAYLATLKDQISEKQKQMSALERQKGLIDDEIDDVTKEITALNNKISELSDNIAGTEAAIVETENSIKSSCDTLSQRLRASYITGGDTTLKLLLGADSVASFLTRLEFMKRVSEGDKKMIDDFKTQATSLKSAKSQLEEEKLEQETARAQLNEKNETLKLKQAEYKKKDAELQSSVDEYEKSYKDVETYIEQLDKNSSVYNDYIDKLERDKNAAEAEMNRIIAAAMTATTTTPHTTLPSENNDPAVQVNPNTGSGDFMWPVGNISCYISSGYGNRTDPIRGTYNSSHGGIDISASGIYGKPIYAAKSGTVIGKQMLTTSYGYYLIIDHGDGFVTLYAHCSQLLANVGDYVVKGQVIAKVGSTGNSTGAHLHFEIRKNGTRVNPLNYVSKP